MLISDRSACITSVVLHDDSDQSDHTVAAGLPLTDRDLCIDAIAYPIVACQVAGARAWLNNKLV